MPDGEPTLDLPLGEAVERRRPLRVPIAVITNGWSLWRPEVRCEVAEADFVSVKVDAGDEATWRRVNRPHPARPWVEMPPLERMVDAHERFAQRLDRVELLIGYEGDDVAISDDAAESLLAITAIHPMRTEVVEELLRRGDAEGSVVEGLMARGDLIELEHNGRSSIARRLPRR